MQRINLIKNTITLILVIGFHQSIIGQNIKNFSKKDTLYYLFKHKKDEIKRGLRVYSPPNLMNMEFLVNIENKENKEETFYFTYYKNKKGNNEVIEIPVLIRNKRFLKLNKDKILTLCDFKKANSKELEKFYWNNHRKVIYLIDKTETKNGEIFLRKVHWTSSYFIQQ